VLLSSSVMTERCVWRLEVKLLAYLNSPLGKSQ